jgi:hypothetical protein
VAKTYEGDDREGEEGCVQGCAVDECGRLRERERESDTGRAVGVSW